jgi:exodeoxyribonuclease-3
MITIASWNINSVKARLEAVTTWLGKNQPDMVLMQEIKCVTDAFPIRHFKDLGYHSSVIGMPAYHGVAILSREPVAINATALPGDPGDIQARFIDVQWRDMRFIDVYCPNGNPLGTEKFDYKLRWLERLRDYCGDLLDDRQKFLVGGDFNIIPEPVDAAHPAQWVNDALYQPESRAHWRTLLNLGLVDPFRALHPHEKDAYTFWDYQAGSWQRDNGIRIDHFLLSPFFADKLVKCWIDKEPRGGEKPSDHTPILAQFDI